VRLAIRPDVRLGPVVLCCSIVVAISRGMDDVDGVGFAQPQPATLMCLEISFVIVKSFFVGPLHDNSGWVIEKDWSHV